MKPFTFELNGVMREIGDYSPNITPRGAYGDDGRQLGTNYFITHLGTRTCVVGQRVRTGLQIGTIADFVEAQSVSLPGTT